LRTVKEVAGRGGNGERALHRWRNLMRTQIAVLLSVLLFCSTPVRAESQRNLPTSGKNTVRVTADSLGALLLNRKLELMTKDGTYLKGKVIAADTNSITIRVDEAEPASRISGREATVRSTDISVVHMKKAGSPALPIVLGIVGAFAAGGPVAGMTDPDASDKGAQNALVFSAMGLGATGGLLLGRRLARKTVIVNVEPGP
jgi:hypothetical protein